MIDKRSIYPQVLLPLVLVLSILFVPLTYADYCGDVNKDGNINILDVVEIINYKYKNGPEPMPAIICDVDQSGSIDILDIIYIINYKYKGGPPPDCGIFNSIAIQGECKSGGTTFSGTQFSPLNDCLGRSDGDNSMYVEMIESDLYVYHENAYYNCCLEYRVEFVIDGSNITAYEYDDGAPCDCICYFNLESVLEDLEPAEYTTYTVTLIGIDGQPVGTDTVEPEDFSYMSLDIIGHNLHVYHNNAYYNCCMEYQVAYSIEENEINIFEYDIGASCYCICFFDLETIIEDIPTGQYNVTLFGFDGDTVGFQSIEIGGALGELTDYSSTGCLRKSRGDLSYLYSDGILTIQDINSIWNCATVTHPIIIEFEQIGDTLRFLEKPTYSGAATCQCPIDIIATVENIVPWTYIAELYRVYDGYDPILKDRREIVIE